ncbi:hypothetical protein GCM10025858_39800 [Alicyclobacillus sacchari]|uniref:hypothetical protein n=1 Tax=Alicyclobacillus sacchari TaxID=392010 RepID=UPI001FBA9B36|nr:hypothetical protein [Alicyclobacillus sacchari]GMA59476.1 hypothetical protein GCM10025858_39800 [Alicyclobacillus sacchari]
MSPEQVIQKYGTWSNALVEFFNAYFGLHGYPAIPDYLLGALVSRAKVVRDKRGRWFMRFVSDDQAQISILRSFMRRSNVYPVRKGKLSLYVRCYDVDLMYAFEHACATEPVFRPTVDFVRGYIDTHSHFRIDPAGRYRLTLTGPLVPECHDFLVALGARNTRVTSIKASYRMNLHAGSLRRVREVLYPPGCVCNPEIRQKMFSV